MLSNAGEGGSIYCEYKPFTVFELMKHIGIYFLNGVSPSPQVEQKMSSQKDDVFNSNNMVHYALGRGGVRCHKHFKCFFGVQDPRLGTPSRTTHPNWKVEPFLKQALRVCKEAMIPGQDCAIDKQTNGFQGHHVDKK